MPRTLGRVGWATSSLLLGAVASGPVSEASAAPVFASVTYELPQKTKTYGAWVADVDADGDDDLFLNDHGKWGRGSGIYRNDQPATPALTNIGGLGSGTGVPDRHDCDVADVDGDRRVDVYCSAGAKWGTVTKVFPQDTNELLVQRAGGAFANVSDVWGVTEPTGRGRDVLFLRADADARPDLVVTNDPRADGEPSGTTLYLNDGGRRFLPRGPAGLLTGTGIRCLERADLDDDGLDDIGLCTVSRGIRLYRNAGASFVDVTAAFAAGPTNTKSWGLALVDVDLDGHEDLVRTDTRSVSVRLWSPAQRAFVLRWSTPAVDAQAVALGPYDRADRLPDLYVLNRGCASCSPPTNPDDVIFRNLGGGTFTRAATVRSGGGTGDFVTAWDGDDDGFVSWVVGNGHGPTPGPVEVVQLAG